MGWSAASLAMAAAPVLAGQKPSESGSPHESHAAAVDRPSPGASGGSTSATTTTSVASSPPAGVSSSAPTPSSAAASTPSFSGASRRASYSAEPQHRTTGGGAAVGTRAAAAVAVKPVAAPTTVASTRCRAAAAHRAGRTTPAAQREAVERQPHGALRRPARTETSRTRIRIVPCRHGAALEAIDPRPEWRCHGPAVPRTAVW